MRTLATALIASFAAACGAPIEPAPEVGAGSTQVIASSVSAAQPEGPAPPGLVLRSFVELVPATPLGLRRATRGSELRDVHEDIARCRVASGKLQVDSPSVSFHTLNVSESGAVSAGPGTLDESDPEAAACVERRLARLALPAQPSASVLGLAVTLLPRNMRADDLRRALPPKRLPAPTPAKPAASAKKPAPPPKKPPAVRPTQTMVGPKYPPELFQRVVRTKFSKIRFCYSRSLLGDPSLAGRVIVKFTVDPKGATRGVKATSDELKSPELLSCIEEAFASMSFPAPDGGPMQVTYPLQLANAGEGPSLPSGATIGGLPVHAIDDEALVRELERFGQVRAIAGQPAFFVIGEDGRVFIFLRLQDQSVVAGGGRCVAASDGGGLAVLSEDDADCGLVLDALLD